MKIPSLVSAFAIASVFAPLHAQDAPSAADAGKPPSSAGVPPGEYLQSALLVVDPANPRLQLELTSGAGVAKSVLRLIDRDRDGKVSPAETENYAAMLARDLIVRFDGREVDLRYVAASEPDAASISSGTETIRLEYAIVHGLPAAGPHKVELKNMHLPAISKYLIRGSAPESGAIRIEGQTVNSNESEGSVAFSYHPPAEPESGSWIGPVLAILGVLALLAGGTFWWLRGRRPVAGGFQFSGKFWIDLWKRLRGERPISARDFQVNR